MTARTPWWRGARGEWWVAAQVVLLAVTALVPRAGPDLVSPARLGPAIALIVGLGGIALMAAGVLALGRSLTILPAPRQDGQLVRAGIYRRVRHPIYGGVMVLAAAWAFYRNSLLHAGLAALVVVFVAIKAAYEERWLLARYPAYAAYRRTTRRFLPWLY